MIIVQEPNMGRRGDAQVGAWIVEGTDAGTPVVLMPDVPENTIFHGLHRRVKVVSDDGGTPTLEIGWAADQDALLKGVDTDLKAVAEYHANTGAEAPPHILAAQQDITALLTDAGTGVGRHLVEIHFTLVNND